MTIDETYIRLQLKESTNMRHRTLREAITHITYWVVWIAEYEDGKSNVKINP